MLTCGLNKVDLRLLCALCSEDLVFCNTEPAGLGTGPLGPGVRWLEWVIITKHSKEGDCQQGGRQDKEKQGVDEGEKDWVVKVKPHVCKRSLTSASALYSFLTAAHIPAVGPRTERDGGGGPVAAAPPTRSRRPERRGRWWSNTGILLIIFSLHFNVFLYSSSPNSLFGVTPVISDFNSSSTGFPSWLWAGYETRACLQFWSEQTSTLLIMGLFQ